MPTFSMVLLMQSSSAVVLYRAWTLPRSEKWDICFWTNALDIISENASMQSSIVISSTPSMIAINLLRLALWKELLFGSAHPPVLVPHIMSKNLHGFGPPIFAKSILSTWSDARPRTPPPSRLKRRIFLSGASIVTVAESAEFIKYLTIHWFWRQSSLVFYMLILLTATHKEISIRFLFYPSTWLGAIITFQYAVNSISHRCGTQWWPLALGKVETIWTSLNHSHMHLKAPSIVFDQPGACIGFIRRGFGLGSIPLSYAFVRRFQLHEWGPNESLSLSIDTVRVWSLIQNPCPLQIRNISPMKMDEKHVQATISCNKIRRQNHIFYPPPNS